MGHTKISGWIWSMGCSLLISDVDDKLDGDPYSNQHLLRASYVPGNLHNKSMR